MFVPHSDLYTQNPGDRGLPAGPMPGEVQPTRDIGVLDRSITIEAGLAPFGATPTLDSQPRRISDFATLGEALDYAAKGDRGMNFHDARGTLVRTYPYSELRRDALDCAARFVALGPRKGRTPRAGRRDRPRIRRLLLRRDLCRAVARAAAAADLVRRTRDLCRPTGRPARQQRPGLVPLPARARRLRRRSRAPPQGRGARLGQPERDSRQSRSSFPSADSDDIAYLQYSSGSTRFPHGVAVTHRALLDNLRAHGVGLEIVRHRPLRLLAALVSRHGPGRLHALADRQPGIGRLSEDRGFRPPPARLARPHQPQSRAPR